MICLITMESFRCLFSFSPDKLGTKRHSFVKSIQCDGRDLQFNGEELGRNRQLMGFWEIDDVSGVSSTLCLLFLGGI